MKGVVFAITALLSLSVFASGSNPSELESIQERIESCQVNYVRALAKKIFPGGEHKLKDRRNKIVVKVRYLNRPKAKIIFYKGSQRQYGHPYSYDKVNLFTRHYSNLEIRLRSIEGYEDNPYITQERTYLTVTGFASIDADINTTKEIKKRDDLGNPVEVEVNNELETEIPYGLRVFNTETEWFIYKFQVREEDKSSIKYVDNALLDKEAPSFYELESFSISKEALSQCILAPNAIQLP